MHAYSMHACMHTACMHTSYVHTSYTHTSYMHTIRARHTCSSVECDRTLQTMSTASSVAFLLDVLAPTLPFAVLVVGLAIAYTWRAVLALLSSPLLSSCTRQTPDPRLQTPDSRHGSLQTPPTAAERLQRANFASTDVRLHLFAGCLMLSIVVAGM